MTKSNWILFGAFAAMVVLQGLTAAQRDRASNDARVLAGLYNGVLIGRGCEPNWSSDEAFSEEIPGRAAPQGLRL